MIFQEEKFPFQKSQASNSMQRPAPGNQQSKVYCLKNVEVQFGDFQALKGVNLDIFRREIIFVTGASGAGKTSLLNLLSGNLRPHKGRVEGPDDLTKDRLFIAQVFQDLRLMMNKTIEENLWFAFDPSLYKNKDAFKREVDELTKILGCYEKLDLKVKDANGGLKQKVAMIRALLSRPNILLTDEPTSSLDKASSNRLFEVLSFYNKKRDLTVIWATHDRELVKNFNHRIVHLENGRLVYTGHACFI